MASERPTGRVTIADVAALAGVSVSAVSKAVNGKGSIAAATRTRIQDAIDKLGWTPSASAVALRTARTHAIGMIAPRSADLLVSDLHFNLLISGIESELAPLDYGLLLHIVGEQHTAERRAYRRLAQERRVDGVILTESLVNDARFDLLRRLGLPAVLVGTPWREEAVTAVHAPGQARGVTEAVEHLTGLGHRKIAYVSGPEDRVHTGFRRRVFEDTLRARGLRPYDVVVADFTAAASAAATAELLGRPERPTAILFANDVMALAGANTARQLGLSVPGDLSVVGYDDLPLGDLCDLQLTTVSQDLVRLGRAAALTLLQLVDPGLDLAVPDIAAPRLVVRASTGPVRA